MTDFAPPVSIFDPSAQILMENLFSMARKRVRTYQRGLESDLHEESPEFNQSNCPIVSGETESLSHCNTFK
jgi:hypothetical protein